jgi:sphingolipid delta-4 desaturase
MGQGTSRNEFEWKHDLEPHRSRRAEILKKYPQIKKLFVVDTLFKWKVTFLVAFQCLSIYLFQDLPFWAIFALAYVLGGTINHSLMLAVHEVSHNQAFGYNAPMLNRLFGLFANLPIGVPISCSFKKYHLLHHRYQGEQGIDTDLPTEWEGRVFRSPPMKALWLILQPVFYGLRPFILHPIPACRLEIANIILQFAADYVVYTLFGWHMLFYLVGGSLLSMGLHPMAGHFITEHFLWAGTANDNIDGTAGQPKDVLSRNKSQANETYETFSYYGPLNMIAWNVGYHMAHHDFPAVPGSLLPEVQRIAPEYYESLPCHHSWTMALVHFITNPRMGPFTRVKRTTPKDQADLKQE